MKGLQINLPPEMRCEQIEAREKEHRMEALADVSRRIEKERKSNMDKEKAIMFTKRELELIVDTVYANTSKAAWASLSNQDKEILMSAIDKVSEENHKRMGG